MWSLCWVPALIAQAEGGDAQGVHHSPVGHAHGIRVIRRFAGLIPEYPLGAPLEPCAGLGGKGVTLQSYPEPYVDLDTNPDPAACVADVARVLVPGGLLCVTELPGDPEKRPVNFNRRVTEILEKHAVNDHTSTTRVFARNIVRSYKVVDLRTGFVRRNAVRYL